MHTASLPHVCAVLMWKVLQKWQMGLVNQHSSYSKPNLIWEKGYWYFIHNLLFAVQGSLALEMQGGMKWAFVNRNRLLKETDCPTVLDLLNEQSFLSSPEWQEPASLCSSEGTHPSHGVHHGGLGGHVCG